MDISVIIPAYNEEEYIRTCIESVLNQNCDQNFEVIVCDDSSIDKTYEILNSIEADSKRLQVLKNNNNSGIISTVRYLTDEASGEFLLRIDADSFLLPGTLQTMYETYKNGADLVFGRIKVKNTSYLHPTAAAIGKLRGRGTWYGGACIGADREKFTSTGGFKKNMVGAEVQELKQRARSHGWNVAQLDGHGVESNFPIKLQPVLRRKFDSGRTHINQYAEEPESFSIWELRGPAFWTVLFALIISSFFVHFMALIALLAFSLPAYQYSRDAILAVEISGRKSFIFLYPAYQMLGAVLRTVGVWSTIDNVFHILRQDYLS